ncbi:uncharacterized protein MCYG_04390 [Microsporum canis CBS 113480]|uniref:Uncharacterized protein n=1 Tax=Arthroderma otae (strain ATCC MYA-4605 / CBS 113480) TaxID=554155 RepID=C5FNF7_ARTOC|nr:uncharacterized protein MCYG_04390 [Microsporum canis CBS 113480]EEQ31571.1 predicted protein [Microsporum canis CBS 113480]
MDNPCCEIGRLSAVPARRDHALRESSGTDSSPTSIRNKGVYNKIKRRRRHKQLYGPMALRWGVKIASPHIKGEPKLRQVDPERHAGEIEFGQGSKYRYLSPQHYGGQGDSVSFLCCCCRDECDAVRRREVQGKGG